MKLNKLYKQTLAPSLSLFTSLSTLICCALPALLVTIGAGAALAGIVSAAPWLVAFSKYKVSAFIIAGIMLLLAATIHYKNRNAPCPANPAQAKACKKLRLLSKWILYLSAAIYLTGFFFAFIAVHIFY